MGASTVSGVRIAGIASAVPSNIRTILQDSATLPKAEMEKIAQSTGVRERHVAPDTICTSDLCHAAAVKLLTAMGWDAGDVDALVFVSQTPDYYLPATACCLHGRLGLAKSCVALDVSLGCSGYVYGLWLLHHLMASSGMNRTLLLAGDTITKLTSPLDRSVATLFGDAGTATALERTVASDSKAFFSLGSDGAGSPHLAVPAGGFRQRRSDATCIRTARESGNVRSDEDLFMNGAEVFSFTLREVPRMVKAVMSAAEWSETDVDAFIFHQANKFMLEYLAKKLKIPLTKVPLSLAEFGNTSSASIPLTIVHCLRPEIGIRQVRLVIGGFGVGFSWAAAALDAGPITVPPVVVIDGQ